MDGFLSVDALRLYMEARISLNSSDEGTTPGTDSATDVPTALSYVFPSLQFSENGLLEKWLFAAELVRMSFSQLEPISIEFQVWRRMEGQVTVINTTHVTSPTRTGYFNVYEYTVDPPLPVQAGDYVGILVQLPSFLRPQWVPQHGVLEALRPENGTALPLFFAQVQGNDDYFQ